MFDDFKFNILDRMPERYFDNAGQLRDKARELGMTVVAQCMNLGWSEGILYHDPNLAEGIPVRDMRYVVADGLAQPAHDEQVELPGGDFEDVQEGRIGGWDWYDDPGQSTFADSETVHSGAYSARMERIGEVNEYGNCRFCKLVQLKPFHYYRLCGWVKTQDLERAGNVRMQALAGEKLHSLAYPDMPVQRTQDWTQYQTVFNSLDYDAVRIYVGVWGGTTGRLWWDDVTLEECGPLNILRRESTPLVVKGEDGTVYEELRDFEHVEDPQLGDLNQTHEAPVIRVTPDSRIADGQTLLVSFYHPGIIGTGDVMCCLSEPRVYEILRDQVQRLNALMQPDVFFMSHDEIRCANWDPPCQARGMTPGQLLADNVTRCVEMIREIAPAAEIAVWSDMLDPHHNAVSGPYYLVNGSLEGSWEGLDPTVTIMNWYSEPAPENNLFFSQRGHMLCGYFDRQPGEFYDPAWLEKTRDVPGIIGVMYTPWSTGYDHIEAWAQAVWGGTR